jgi:predicted dehydrogenase
MFTFGIIGAGSIANRFCEAARLLPGAEVAAVSSKDAARAAVFAQNQNVKRSYGSYREMLQNEKLDGVYIATTHNFHHGNLLLCIEHGVPALCEKCFVLTEAEAISVFGAANRAGVFVMEAMWSRFLPAYRKAAEWIDLGAIGEIASAHYKTGFKAPGDHRVFKPEIAGGSMFDIGVYAVEGLTGLIKDELVDIKCAVKYAECGVDTTEHIILNFKNCIATAEATILASVLPHLEIFGSEGIITMPLVSFGMECFLDVYGKEREIFTHKFTNGFEYEIEHFISCIKSGMRESPIMPHSATLQCARIFDTVLAASPARRQAGGKAAASPQNEK